MMLFVSPGGKFYIGEWAEGFNQITRRLDKLVMDVPEESYDEDE